MGKFFSNVWGGIKSIGNFLNPLAVGTAKAPAPKTGYNVYGEPLGPYDPNRSSNYNPFDVGSYASLIDALNNASKPRYIPPYTAEMSYNEGEARSRAESQYNPEYEKKWATASEGFKTQKARAKEDYNIGAQLEADALDRFLEQTGLLKTRSAEDLTTALTSLAAQRGEARAETSYERVRQLRSLVNELSTKGLSFGGMAKTAGKEATQGRMLAKNKLERQYGEAVSGEQTKATRTGEDIAMQEETRQAENKARLDELLRTKTRTLKDVAFQEKQTKELLDIERKNKIALAMSSDWQKSFQLWEMGLEQHKAQYGY